MMSSNSTQTQATVRACPDCDLLQALPLMEVGQAAYCVRCGCLLSRLRRDSLNRSLAFAVTGIFLFILANLFPFISLSALGVHQDSTSVFS